jgi:hypothetical protein
MSPYPEQGVWEPEPNESKGPEASMHAATSQRVVRKVAEWLSSLPQDAFAALPNHASPALNKGPPPICALGTGSTVCPANCFDCAMPTLTPPPTTHPLQCTREPFPSLWTPHLLGG